MDNIGFSLVEKYIFTCFVNVLYKAFRNLGLSDQNITGDHTRYVEDIQETMKSTNGGALNCIKRIL